LLNFNCILYSFCEAAF